MSNEYDFPKAEAVERGCGKRVRGGLYLECGLVPAGQGTPFDHFLVDPPQEPPEGVDLINKPQLWSSDPRGDNPIWHILIWIGEEHYPYLPDYLEEGRRYGLSRRIRANLDFEKLGSESRMILIHPRTINDSWEAQTPPSYCPKQNPEHLESITTDAASFYSVTVVDTETLEEEFLEETKTTAITSPVETGAMPHPASGPCLGKLYDLLPVPEGQLAGELSFRTMPSFRYTYIPTGEAFTELRAGVFGIFPITGIALVRQEDGTVDPAVEERVSKAGVPYYCADA